MTDRAMIDRFTDAIQRLDKEQQHTIAVLLHLMVTDPAVGKLDADGISDLYQRLSRKRGEADAA